MQKTTLGKTDIQVPCLGIGAWSWGDPLFWNYGKNFGIAEVQSAFNTAVEAGITFFDTAEVYGEGKSEKLLGQFMQDCSTPVTIATKYGQFPWRFTKKAVQTAIDQSLERLQIQQIPLYQVHWPFSFFMTEERLMNALADAVEMGKIRAIGVSNYSAEQMEFAHHLLEKRGLFLAVNQVKYSLLSRRVERKGIIQKAKELGITILAYSPLAQGLLTGKYRLDTHITPDGARKIDSRFQKKGLTKITPILNLLDNLSEKYGKTPAQIALNWLVAQENVIPIPGAKNAKQAQENSGALGWQLIPEDLAQLEAITRNWL